MLDPILLLHEIRHAQEKLVKINVSDSENLTKPAGDTDLKRFLSGLEKLWHKGEARPTHRKTSRPPRWWRTRKDPFEHAWPLIDAWLQEEPALNAREIMNRLIKEQPEKFPDDKAIRTLQRRMRERRQEEMRRLINAED